MTLKNLGREKLPNDQEMDVFEYLIGENEMHAYEMVKRSQNTNRPLSRNSIYTVLMRMSERGYLNNRVEKTEGRRGLLRRYYKISAHGVKMRQKRLDTLMIWSNSPGIGVAERVGFVWNSIVRTLLVVALVTWSSIANAELATRSVTATNVSVTDGGIAQIRPSLSVIYTPTRTYTRSTSYSAGSRFIPVYSARSSLNPEATYTKYSYEPEAIATRYGTERTATKYVTTKTYTNYGYSSLVKTYTNYGTAKIYANNNPAVANSTSVISKTAGLFMFVVGFLLLGFLGKPIFRLSFSYAICTLEAEILHIAEMREIGASLHELSWEICCVAYRVMTAFFDTTWIKLTEQPVSNSQK